MIFKIDTFGNYITLYVDNKKVDKGPRWLVEPAIVTDDNGDYKLKRKERKP